MSVPRSVMYRSLCERTFCIFDLTVNNTGGESQNVKLSLVADNTMLHRSLEVLHLKNHMEPAEAATALDAIFTDSASVSMANEDDEQRPNTLKESLDSIEAEHSKSGCLATVCEKLQKAAVEGVRGVVYQQFQRALKDASTSRKRRIDYWLGLQAKKAKTHKPPHVFAASAWRWALHFQVGQVFDAIQVFCTSRRALMRLYQARAWRGERAKGSGTNERGEAQVKTIECPQISPAKQKKPKFSDAIDVTDTPFKEPSAKETSKAEATC